jgi:hypothetical protein
MAIEAITRVPVLSVLTIFEDWFVVLPQHPKPLHQHNPLRLSSCHTEPVARHFFTSLKTRRCGNCLVRIFTTKHTDTLSVSFFHAKDSTVNTLFRSELYFSWPPINSLTNTDCTALIQSSGTLSVIWSYVSHLQEMLCVNDEDCADWWKGSRCWGKTTNQSSKIVKTLSTGTRMIATITMDELQKVSHNLFMQCEACLQAEGGPFQHLL